MAFNRSSSGVLTLNGYPHRRAFTRVMTDYPLILFFVVHALLNDSRDVPSRYSLSTRYAVSLFFALFQVCSVRFRTLSKVVCLLITDTCKG